MSSVFKKRQLDELELLKQSSSLLLEHIYWKDREGKFIWANDKQIEYMGFKTLNDVLGLTALDTLLPDDAQKIMDIDEKVMTTGEEIELEEVVAEPGGKKSIWLSKKLPIKNHNNEVVGIMGMSLNITAEKQLEIADLLANAVAHEIRSPLLNISLTADYLQRNVEKLSSAETQQEIQAIKDTVKVTNGLLDIFVANLRENIEVGHKQACYIHDCIEQAIQTYPFQDDYEVQSIAYKKPTVGNNFVFYGQLELIKTVMVNLIKNALLAIKKTGDFLSKKIIIETIAGKTMNQVFIRDQGIGIEPKHLPYVFNKYFTTTGVGSGIGLSFCKLIMEQAIGGEIHCQSEKGKGTTFILTFPCMETESL